MNTERWRRIEDLFEKAQALPPDERACFLDSACGQDADLRTAVISLLEAPGVEEMPTAWLGSLAAPETPRFPAGDRVAGRYVIGDLLGRGGMGEVYEAWDEELAITVALKTLRLADRGDDALQQLKLEGLLARAVWHPNVCRVYDLDRHDDDDDTVWVLIMERLHGTTLARRLRERGPLPLDRALRLADQMAAGLGAAHQAGVVHRDFKPGNVMLVPGDGEEQAIVTDFGTARAAQGIAIADSESATAAGFGTPEYMAPEQVRGEDAGPAADVYALGVTLFEMVTGRQPFTGDSPEEIAQRRLEQDPPSARSLVPGLDERWEAVILRCMAREPRHRFARVEEVAEALKGRAPTGGEAVEIFSRDRHGSLPPERDPFVGREAELDELERNLAASRLVTLLGAGGMGKTRLASRFGWRSHASWPGGVWFCDLTEARDSQGMASAIAGSLGIPLGLGDPLEQLGHAIAARGRCLLILDNVEQVIEDAAATAGRWLKSDGEASYLATSRERLNLDAECVQPVEPLGIEAGAELFTTRARGLRPALELDADDSERVRDIVRIVDGMPLAIELAAARTRVMTVAQILDHMRHRFRLLTGGRGERHETLRGSIDASWELLSPWEQSAWVQCSVFEGGFTLAAADAVLDLAAWPEAPWVVDVLRSLTDKSLLRTTARATAGGAMAVEPRFGMYASLQEYAAERLATHGEGYARAAFERHGIWYARLGGDEAIAALDVHGGGRRRAALQFELDNLIAACRRAIVCGDGECAVATFRAAWAVLELQGPFKTALDLGREILACVMSSGARARAAMTMASVEWRAKSTKEAIVHAEEALALYREAGDDSHEGEVLGMIAASLVDQGRLAEAQARCEAALEIVRQAGPRRVEGALFNRLGIALSHQGHLTKARDSFEAALAISREVGDRRLEGMVLNNLGLLDKDMGRMNDARASLDLALDVHRETGNRRSEGIVLAGLATMLENEGHDENARAILIAALRIHRDIGNRRSEAPALGNLANVLSKLGQREEARTHGETAMAIAREVGDGYMEAGLFRDRGHWLLEWGDVDEAREALTRGEELFRTIGAPLEIAMVLCYRADLELKIGEKSKARVTLGEVEELLARAGLGVSSDLGVELAKRRAALGTPGG